MRPGISVRGQSCLEGQEKPRAELDVSLFVCLFVCLFLLTGEQTILRMDEVYVATKC